MRTFIDIMENFKPDDTILHIAEMIRSGETEGFSPYWKLSADPRLLADQAAMHHIAELIEAGYTSGHGPAWELKTIDNSDSHMAPVDVTREEPSPYIGATLDEDKHKVVAVHQRDGEGNGWWECPDEHAELFVVEDEGGEPVASYDQRHAAEAHASHLNSGGEVIDTMIDHPHEELLLDDDIDPTDDASAYIPTMYSDAPDHEVEIAAVHERGFEQEQAMQELHNRGIELSPVQLARAHR